MRIDDVTLKTLQLRHFPAAGARTGERANHTKDFMIKTADARLIWWSEVTTSCLWRKVYNRSPWPERVLPTHSAYCLGVDPGIVPFVSPAVSACSTCNASSICLCPCFAPPNTSCISSREYCDVSFKTSHEYTMMA